MRIFIFLILFFFCDFSLAQSIALKSDILNVDTSFYFKRYSLYRNRFEKHETHKRIHYSDMLESIFSSIPNHQDLGSILPVDGFRNQCRCELDPVRKNLKIVFSIESILYAEIYVNKYKRVSSLITRYINESGVISINYRPYANYLALDQDPIYSFNLKPGYSVRMDRVLEGYILMRYSSLKRKKYVDSYIFRCFIDIKGKSRFDIINDSD